LIFRARTRGTAALVITIGLFPLVTLVNPASASGLEPPTTQVNSVELQALLVTSTVAQSAQRDNISVTEAPAVAAISSIRTGPVPAPAVGASIIETAYAYIGTPYVSMGNSPAGFDCSGFTSYVYAQHGISIPRTARGQWGAGTAIPESVAQPGDLVVLNGGGHIGIWISPGVMIDAPVPGSSVGVHNTWGSYSIVRIG
jgi:cell wall-associated NlpC family hydrolase